MQYLSETVKNQGRIMYNLREWRLYVTGALKSSTTRNTLWLGSASVVTGLIGALTSAILARWLGVDGFGTLTLVLSMLALMTDLSDLGVTSSIVRFGAQSVAEGDEGRFKVILSIVLRAKIVLGSIMLILGFFVLRPLASYLFGHVDEEIQSYVFLLLVALVLSIAAGVFYPIYQSFSRFRAYSLLSSARSGVKLLLVALCVIGMSYLTVALTIWIEVVSILLYLFASYRFSPVKTFSLSLSDRSLQRDMFLFNRWISLYYIINLLTIRLDVFFVAGLLDANSLGLYSGASKISTLVILVANAYLTVLLVEMSSAPSAESLRTRTKSAVGTVLFFSAGIVILALTARPVVQLLYGEQFVAAGRILQIMCVGLVFTVLAYPINASLYAANRSAVFPVMAAVAALGLVGGNVYLIPRYGAEGAAMAFSGSGFLAWSVLAIYYFIGTRSLHGNETLSPGMSDRGLRGVK